MNNVELMNQIHDHSNPQYKETVPRVATAAEAAEAFSILEQYPTQKNDFLSALTNKVMKSFFYSKVFKNPLQMLHRGMMPMGASIEQIFVNMAIAKGFMEDFGDNATDSLIGKEDSEVNIAYITKNFAKKYKVTISDQQLRTAFTNPTGLYELITQLTNSAISAAYFDEFNDMKGILKSAAAYKKFTMDTTGNLKEEALDATKAKQYMAVAKVGATPTPATISESIRALAGRLKFPSTKFNMAAVRNWTERENLIFITTPELIAKLDVNVLADAFNVSKAEVNVRTIEVDELPAVAESASVTHAANKVVGLLVDKDFIQAYDTLMETRQFENGDKLWTNVFMHKQGIMANCYFANAVAIVMA